MAKIFRNFVAIISFLVIALITGNSLAQKQIGALIINTRDDIKRDISIYEVDKQDDEREILLKFKNNQLALVKNIEIIKTAKVSLPFSRYFIVQKEKNGVNILASAIIDFNEEFKNPLNLKDLIEVPLENDDIKIIVHKVNDKNQNLSKVGFKLYKIYEDEDESLKMSEKLGDRYIDVVGVDPISHTIKADNPTLYTDNDGMIYLSELKKSTYYLKEVETPKEYKGIEGLIPLENTLITAENVIVNNPEYNSRIIIRKLDKTDKTLLDGAVFKLFKKQEDKLVDLNNEKTTLNGICSFEKLQEGNYVIREIKVPTKYKYNYKLLAKDIEVNLDSNNTEVKLDVENARDPKKPPLKNIPNVNTGVKSVFAVVVVLVIALFLYKYLLRKKR